MTARSGRLGRSLLALVVAGFVIASVTATRGAEASAASRDAPAARRMLIVSLPAVTWADLPLDRMPNLRGVLEQSLIAGLSLRGVHDDPTLGDAYVTIASGARAVGGPRDGDAIVDRDGAVVVPAFPGFVDHNQDLLYDAHPGALATALRRAHIDRAVIGNGDEGTRVATSARKRPVANALATPDGITPGGDVGEHLMEADASSPFGVRVSSTAYLAAFRRAWTGRTVVSVEDSDLARLDATHPVDAGDRTAQLGTLLARFDQLFGQMLTSVDPQRDAVMLVGPIRPSGPLQLTVASLRVPGIRPGLAVSGVTRRSGFVSIVDIAPTILDVFRIEAPDSMEGRPIELGRAGGSFTDRRSFLIGSNRGARFRDARSTPVGGVFLGTQLGLLVAAAFALTRWGRVAKPMVELFALTLLGFLPAMFLAGLLPFDRHSVLLYWIFLFGVAIAIGIGAALVSDREGIRAPMVCLAIIVGLHVVDLVTGAHLQINTVFGYTPTVGGRFAGIGNFAFAELSAAALLLAGLVVFRVGTRRGAALAVMLLGLALVVDGMPIWGSDVGGVLAMVPAFAVAVTGLLGLRVRMRSLLIGAGAAVVAIVAFALVDLSRPADSRTHLGRLVTSTRSGGWHSFAIVIERKLSGNIDALWPSQWTVMVPIMVVLITGVIALSPGHLRAVYARIPPLRPVLLALAVLAVLGFALNDSGIRTPGVMLGVAIPVLVVILLRADRAHDQSQVPAGGEVA